MSLDNFRTINHEGIVQKTGENSVFVSISSESACSGCHAEGSCTLSGKEEKIIEVPGKHYVRTGERVTVYMNQSMGYTAIIIGYVLPLLLVLLMLIVLNILAVPELASGIASISILFPYYLIIFLIRNMINKKFTFTLKG